MDIRRTDLSKKKRIKKYAIIGGSTLALILVFIFLDRMGPAAPVVEKSAVWVGEVKSGDLVRKVRGIGTLVPKDQRWLTAQTNGSVEEILILPGALVQPDTVILELSNPELQQNYRNSILQLASAEAQLANQRVREEDSLLELEYQLAQLVANFENAKLDVRVNEELFAEGLVAERDLIRSQVAKEQWEQQKEILSRRLNSRREQMEQNLAPAIANLEQERERVSLLEQQVSDLKVRAGLEGLLQRLPLEEGQQVSTGTQLAQVANPTLLKATVRIPETQAKDIQIGQVAEIDTRNGIIAGEVARVNPTVTSGTVDIDINLLGELPKGARADLTVEGYVQLDNLRNVLYINRPSFARENSQIGVYLLSESGDEATRTIVSFGKSSVNEIEITSGLQPGDRIILSDSSQWDGSDRIRLK